MFSIIGTPPWANGGRGRQRRARRTRSTSSASRPRPRARYSGKFKAPDGRVLPPVRQWLAWNEPNNPAFLRPQYTQGRRASCVIQSAIDYAKICNAIVKGVRDDHGRRLEGRLRRHRPARQQQPELRPARRLAARRSCAR